MKASNCSYCGMLTTDNKDICESCKMFFPADNQPPAFENAEPSAENESLPMNHFDSTLTSTVTNTKYVRKQTRNHSRFESSNQQAQSSSSESKCLKCGISTPYGQRKCSKCINKKFPTIKVGIVFVVLVALLGTFSFGYIYEFVSPWGVVRKYAKATGADDSIIYENFSFKGDAKLVAKSGIEANPLSVGLKSNSLGESVLGEFSFEMVFKKPNKMSVEFTQGVGAGKEVVLKQAFDGISGWKYTNLPNQPAGYQDTDDDFAFENMGMGLDDYESVEFADSLVLTEFGSENIDVFDSLKTFRVEGVQQRSLYKAFVTSIKKKNGKTEKSLLCFDQETGFLLAMITFDKMKDSSMVSTIIFDEYDKFPVKKQGMFGVEDDFVLIPTKTKITMKEHKTSKVISMGGAIIIELKIKTLDIDALIDDRIFVKSFK